MKNVYYKIIEDPRYKEGILYGKPRRGHSEGTVQAHIAELEQTLATLCPSLNENQYWRLKVLIHVHDAFKKWAKRDSPIDDVNSHASLARAFLNEYILGDEDMLNMVQYHDENFALWKQLKNKGAYSVERMKRSVIDRIKDIDLFLIFTIIDGNTKSKLALRAEEEPEKLRWFVDEVAKYRPVGTKVYKVFEMLGL